MPTSAVTTYSGQRLIPWIEPDDAPRRVVNLKASTTYAAGTVVGEITATPGTFGPYASGNSDGSQTAKGVLEYACVTDSSGNVTLGGTGVTAGEWGQTSKGAPMFISGYFLCQDLTGLDAGAVTALGKLIQGTTSNGILNITGA